MVSRLFTPLRLRDMVLDNRVVFAPMCMYAAEDGDAGDWHLMHYGSYALSGAGLIITEATAVEPIGRISPHCLGLYSDANERALARVVAFVRRYTSEIGDIRFAVQLAHSGRKAPGNPSFAGRRALTPEQGGWLPVAPSADPYPGYATPVPLDEAGLARVKHAWVEATKRAERLGFDAIEMHYAHGYLMNQFLSPLSNRRTDGYGGSLEGRMRFPLEVFRACREAWPERKPMGARITATDWVDGGWDMDDSIALGKALKALGCDFIVASSGGVAPEQQIASGPGYQVPFAARLRAEAGIATMAVGQITEAQQAEDILAEGNADLIALARAMLDDPRWPWHAARALGDHVIYAARYNSCHPALGAALKFAEEQIDGRTRMARLDDARRRLVAEAADRPARVR